MHLSFVNNGRFNNGLLLMFGQKSDVHNEEMQNIKGKPPLESECALFNFFAIYFVDFFVLASVSKNGL